MSYKTILTSVPEGWEVGSQHAGGGGGLHDATLGGGGCAGSADRGVTIPRKGGEVRPNK